MDKPQFVYFTYISTTPEKLWSALTDPPLTRQYWQHDNVSDWKPGSKWEHRRSDAAGTVDLIGKVIESAPPRRLVLTWASAADTANPPKHSRVTFDIHEIKAMVRLTVTHDELEPGSDMLRGIREGWPRVLSSLKTFLETGTPLRTWEGKNA